MIKPHDSLVVQLIARFNVPFIQIFGCYVLLHGHYSPGGGFQSGVLIGAAFILQMLVTSNEEQKQYSIQREFFVACLGIIIFLVLGALALAYNEFFLDYGALEFLNDKVANRRYLSLYLVEIAVTMTVAMTVVIIFNVLARSRSNSKELQWF
jgi:multicomponent Na+:H+ antiporter subunit B